MGNTKICFTVGRHHLDALAAFGDGKQTTGLRKAARAWEAAERPELPEDDHRHPGRGGDGADVLPTATLSLDPVTVGIVKAVGGSFGQAVRRLALWVEGLDVRD